VREFAQWLYGTAPSVAVYSTFWAIRLLQATHLLAAGIVAGSGVMIALRAMGLMRTDQPFESVWSRFAPWLAGGLAVMAATGIAQTLADPVRELMSTSYWVKLALLISSVTGTWLLSRVAQRSPATFESSFGVKLVAAALIAAWLALPLLGRMIGYDLAIWGRLSLRA
jgi:hypothetical protein